MNSSTQDKQSTEATSESFGERIRQAREEQQLSIDDLVRETRIHPQHLIDLEQGKTSGISAPGYVVGYLKTLAKVLELDAEVLIQDFKTSTNQEIHQTIDPEHELLPPKQKQAAFGWSTVFATSIIVLAVIGALLYYWFGDMRDGPLDSSDTDVFDDDKTNRVDTGETNPTSSDDSISSVGSEDSVTGTEGAVGNMSLTGTVSDNNEAPPNGNGTEEATNSNPQSEQTNASWQDVMNLTQRESNGDASNDSSNEPVENEEDDQNSSDETLANQETEAAAEEEPPLLFEFSDTSWVEVTDADENQLISETREAGTTLELDGKEPFTIKLGFAPGVTLYFNGSKVELESHTQRNTAELTLPP